MFIYIYTHEDSLRIHVLIYIYIYIYIYIESHPKQTTDDKVRRALGDAARRYGNYSSAVK